MDERNVALFLADYDHQVAHIQNIYSILEKKSIALSEEKVSSETVESTGYWLHNLYCACEDLFKLVAGFWENSVDSDGTFHKELLRRMILMIEGIRPALLTEKSFQYLNELRGFRHVFRHAYSYGLDDERVIYLLRKIMKHQNSIFDDFAGFRQKVASILK